MPKKKKEMLAVFYILWTIFVIAMGSFVNTWQRIHILKCGYLVQSLQVRHRELLDSRNNLILERNRLRTLVRVEHIARGKLGMVMAEPEDHFFLVGDRDPRHLALRYATEEK